MAIESTATFLARLIDSGLVDELARGHCAIRPSGARGASWVTHDPIIAIGADEKAASTGDPP
ncbi:MAG: hypothetical protein HKL85_09335 [Acidimicrobiaceae bacterium]|nr:hypothetical protein [Acidimicrobiaceae bacterium]